jgi:hypothetical protein
MTDAVLGHFVYLQFSPVPNCENARGPVIRLDYNVEVWKGCRLRERGDVVREYTDTWSTARYLSRAVTAYDLRRKGLVSSL